jgi:predicted TPR repeat methyltransferase
MTAPKREERVQWVYAAQNNQELAERYDAWAKEYDADVQSLGYKIPGIITGLMGRYVQPSNTPVLDAGAGTGIMGELLTNLRYDHLMAMDLSQGMLDVAGGKNVYKGLRQMVMGEHLDFPDSMFAATVASGVLSLGHAPPSSFDELVRVTRPGGAIIFSVRADIYLTHGFKEKQEALVKDGKWRVLEMTEPFQSLPLGEPEVRHQVFAYEVR